jgi:hypothetical protein
MLDQLIAAMRGAGAGRGKVNPPTVEERKMEAKRRQRQEMSPGEREMVEDVEDQKMREKVKSMGYAKGGKVGSASKRADGCAERGKTRGKMV